MTHRIAFLLALTSCTPMGPPVTVRDAYSYESVLGNVGAVYFTVENRGSLPDTLVEVEVAGALVAMIHEQVAVGEMMEMRHVGSLPLPPHSTVELKPGGLHIMTEGLDRAPVAGDTLVVTARFARGGALTVKAPVLAYGAER